MTVDKYNTKNKVRQNKCLKPGATYKAAGEIVDHTQTSPSKRYRSMYLITKKKNERTNETKPVSLNNTQVNN
ncbi:hypothetical protein BLOT_016325 [Blomia tropicalis]|nr:hypothetical protein BLOT_016325 [Blomia tropicalis]